MSYEICRSFLLLVLPTGACQRKGAEHEATMCLKNVHSDSSLSGALIVNLWLSFDYRFDYRFFCVRKPRGFLDHLSRIIIIVFLGGHIVFHAFLRCHRHLGPLLTKFNYIYSDRGSYVSIYNISMYICCICIGRHQLGLRFNSGAAGASGSGAASKTLRFLPSISSSSKGSRGSKPTMRHRNLAL